MIKRFALVFMALLLHIIVKADAIDDIHYCPRNSFNISKSNKLIVTHQN